MKRSWNRAVRRTRGVPLPLLAVGFLASLGFSVVLPFLVYVVTALGGNAFVMGALGAAFAAAQLVGAPLLGYLSDRLGRKPVLFASQLGGAAAWAIFAVALNVPPRTLVRIPSHITGDLVLTWPLVLIVVSRVTDGLFNGSISVANAYVTDVTPEEDRQSSYGRLGAAWSVGFVLGPAIAGFLARGGAGVGPLVTLAGVLSLVGAAAVWFLLPAVPCAPCAASGQGSARITHEMLGGGCKEAARSLSHTGRAGDASKPEPRPALSALLTKPEVLRLLSLYFGVFLGFSVFLAAFPIHAQTELHWNSGTLGASYSGLSICLVVTQVVIVPRASRRASSAALAVVGSVVLALGYALLVLPRGAAAFAGTALYGVGNGLMWPSYLAILSRTGDASSQGVLQGVATSTGSLASIVGMVAGGLAFGWIGARVFLISSATLIACAAVFLSLAREDRH